MEYINKLIVQGNTYEIQDKSARNQLSSIANEVSNNTNSLNEIREEYLKETNGRKKNKLIRRAKQLLPEGFLQLRTMDTNYSEIRNIVLQRRNHRLKEEWQDCFCKEMTKLPYAKELIIGED